MDVIILDMGDEIKGESSVRGYENKIELLSFSHAAPTGITGDISSSGRTSGKPNHQDMMVTGYLDGTASPGLHQCAMEGNPSPG